MYTYIESEYKDIDYLRKFSKFVIISCVISFIIYFILVQFIKINVWISNLIIAIIGVIALVIYEKYFFYKNLSKKNRKLNFKKKIQVLKKKKIFNLAKILISANIKSRDDVKVVYDYYNNLKPKLHKINIFEIITLIISSVSLIIIAINQNGDFNINMLNTIVNLLSYSVIVLVIVMLIKYFYNIFCKEELYDDLHNYIAYIYFEYEDYYKLMK